MVLGGVDEYPEFGREFILRVADLCVDSICYWSTSALRVVNEAQKIRVHLPLTHNFCHHQKAMGGARSAPAEHLASIF